MEKIRKEAKKFFSGSTGSHDFDHIERVFMLCKHIGKVEKADLKILLTAALLHDIGRPAQDQSGGKICHAEEGAKLASKLLIKLGWKPEEIEKVNHCILSHRYRGNVKPQSLEAKILSDADKIDAIGAVGIGRDFLFAGEIGAMLHNRPGTKIEETAQYSKDDTAYREYFLKLRFIKERILTNEGRRLAEGRDKFMHEFFDRFLSEIKGEI